MTSAWTPFSLLVLLGLAFAVGCPTSGDDDDAVGDDDDAVADPCADYAAPGAWEDLDEEERRAYMTCVVVPTMAPMFQEFDEERFAGFGCVTCHGEDREAVEHEMPNGLEELPLSGFPFSNSSDPDEAAIGAFMEDDVVGEMAQLLGRSRNPNSPDYFGCYDCHVRP